MDFIIEKGQIILNNDGRTICCKTIYDNTELDTHEYGLAYLQGKVHKAELDYYRVRVNKDSTGYIFPVALLSEEDKSTLDDIQDSFFFKFANVGTRLLLDKFFSQPVNMNAFEGRQISLDDIYDDDISIFVYRKSVIDDVTQYRQSLYMDGYILLSDSQPVDNIYVSSIIKNCLRESDSKNLTLKKNSNIWSLCPAFFAKLYGYILPFIDNPFYRYFSLYQVFEIAMDSVIEKEFIHIVRSYLSGKNKHRTVREKFKDVEQEIKKLHLLHENVNVNTQNFHNFTELASNILEEIGIDYAGKKEYVYLMYKIRNTMVHNLNLLLPYEEMMRRLSEYFEFTIDDFLRNREDLVENIKLDVFFIDKTKTLTENIENFKNSFDAS